MSAENVAAQGKHHPEEPIIVSDTRQGTEYVYCANKSAIHAGIQPNMLLIDAINIKNKCIILKRDERDEKLLIKDLVEKLRKFSPWISTKKDNSLLLNITGCSHLFDGEKCLAQEILLEMKNTGFTSSIGIGSSPSVAISAAIFKNNYKMGIDADHNILSGNHINHEVRTTRFASKIRPITTSYVEEDYSFQILEEDTNTFVSKLPINILDLTTEELNDLYFLGLKKISHLSKLKYNKLLKYFGREFCNKLETTLGTREEPISPLEEQYKPIYCKEFIYPIISKNKLILEIQNIIELILERLEENNALIKRILFTFVSSKLEKEELKLELKTATKEASFIISLLKIKIDRVKFLSDIQKFTVSIKETGKYNPLQSDMKYCPTNPTDVKDINSRNTYMELISKISIRIGENNIQKIYLENTHIPEKVSSTVPIDTKVNNITWKESGPALRPVYLFSPKRIEVEKFEEGSSPKACIINGARRYISAAFGPEKVAPEWWCQNSIWELHTRDYWAIELEEGEKFWVFELKNGKFSNQWYIHGNFC